MRVFTVSDVHVDFGPNRQWVRQLSDFDYQHDLLIVAGDLTDDERLLTEILTTLTHKFQWVVFVPGNHEAWVHRSRFSNSLEKFYWVLKAADELGVVTERVTLNGIDVVPLYSWYDYSFAPLNEQLEESWSDFRLCNWPMSVIDLAAHFHNMNEITLCEMVECKWRISVSHFMPRIELLPDYIPKRLAYLWPVLGSTTLGEQVERLRPDIHIYGHSHVNTKTIHQGIKYVNNAFGYPNERTWSGLLQLELI
ncbi:metallophosphoesterase [Vibrio vulnificus]|uniref:metallophosphoesterase family protein n=1 Tax=Marinagarivorans algicola TaxID=1513270 RepID=UPI0006B526ED|nr:metallophosphoesterase [Marinagarivorans algicola]EGQ9933736.1 metallophosphoesterase [Vibrio vulnificus]